MSEFNQSYVGLRQDILGLIKNNCECILDVGCATGENGKYLMEKGITKKVIGIELDPEMGKEAEKNLSSVVIGDLEDSAVIEALQKEGPYDYILLGDILEHIRDPWKILNNLSNMLCPDGKVVISTPNVQHIDVLRHIYFKGYWPYNQRGIFDRTHLRWFTLKNLQELVDEANLSLLEIKRNFRYRDRLDSEFPIHGRFLIKFFKNLYTHQYVLLCQRKSES